jgi:hypothetical protein
LQVREIEKITGMKYEDEHIGVLYLSAIEALVFAAAHECFHLSPLHLRATVRAENFSVLFSTNHAIIF